MSTLYVDTITEKTSGNGVQIADLVPKAGSVVQVKSVTMTDQQSFTGVAFTDITDGTNALSISITPTSSSSKFLLMMNITASANNGGSRFGFRFMRDSTPVGNGVTEGSRTPVAVQGLGTTSNNIDEELTSIFLDNPATASAITYKIQGHVEQTTSTCIINRSNTNSNSISVYRTASSFTIMEIAQ
jgi:hypothetical protein